MPELAVNPAALLDLAGELGTTGDRLTALVAALPSAEGVLGSDDMVHALENSAHAWQYTLQGAAVAVDVIRDQLVQAATAYEGVDALVRDWSGR